MKDDVARTLAKRALKIAIGSRPEMFVGKCALCAMPCRGRYCHAHDWMYGNANEGTRPELDAQSAGALEGGPV